MMAAAAPTLVAVLVGAIFARNRIPAPIRGAVAAARAGDWNELERHVALDSVAHYLAEEWVEELFALAYGDVSLDDIEFGRKEGPRLIREEIEHLLLPGGLDSVLVRRTRPPLHPDSMFSLNVVLTPDWATRLGLGEVSLDGVRTLWKRGDRMQLALRFDYPALDTVFELPLELLRYDQGWRVIRVRYFETSSAIARHREERLVRAHQQQLRRMNEALQTHEVIPSFQPARGMRFFNTYSISVYARNRSDKTITQAYAKVFLKNYPDEFVIASWKGRAAPDRSFVLEYSDITSGGSFAIALEAENPRAFDSRLVEIVFEDGERMRIPESYELWQAEEYHGVQRWLSGDED